MIVALAHDLEKQPPLVTPPPERGEQAPEEGPFWRNGITPTEWTPKDFRGGLAR